MPACGFSDYKDLAILVNLVIVSKLPHSFKFKGVEVDSEALYRHNFWKLCFPLNKINRQNQQRKSIFVKFGQFWTYVPHAV